jgi:hypothetical protein
LPVAADARGTPAEIGKPANVNAVPAALGWLRACYLLATGIPAAASGGAKLLKLAVKVALGGHAGIADEPLLG